MNPSTAEAAVLIDELIAGGVSDAVLASGSRSAPLAFALYAAERAGRITLHVRTDERTAAFLAVGLARGTGRPVPIVTTSGTAVANLHPAVLEAHHDGVPLVVLTADRPPRLRGVGANQTTSHMTMFAAETLRYRVELAVAQRVSGQNGYWRGQVCRALAAATGAFHSGRGGPVHLNVPFDVPLVPDGDIDEYDAVLGDANAEKDTSGVGRIGSAWPESLSGRKGPWSRIGGQWAGAPSAAGGAVAAPRTGEKCLFIASLTSRLAQGVAEAGYPVVAEGGGLGGSAVLAAGEHLLADAEFMAAHRPDRVIVLGRPTLFRSVTVLLETPGIAVDVVDFPAEYADPAGKVRMVASALGDVMDIDRSQPNEWLAAWQCADDAAQQAISRLLAAEPALGSAGVARTVGAVMPDGAALLVGSSQTPRDVGRYTAARNGISLLANRGVAGIDGTVSTAMGLALARAAAGEGPTYAMMGDLTFLHDATGLAIGPKDARPDVTLVVVNNDGGGIFAALEQGEPAHAAAFERVFGTPSGVRIGPIVEGLGGQYEHIGSRDRLSEAIAQRPSGIRVLEVPVDRSGLRQLGERVAAAVHDALR